MLGNHGRPVAKKVFTPLARLLTKMHVTANAVTVTGTVATVVASIGLLATGYVWIGVIVLGVILFADALDGVLARLTGTSSVFGGFLDSTLDRISDGAVFGSLLFWVVVGMEPSGARTVSIAAGIACMVLVGTVPYARAKAESVGVPAKLGIAERTDRLIIILVCAFAVDLGLPDWVLSVGFGWVAFASLATVLQRIWFTRRELAKMGDGSAQDQNLGEGPRP